MRYTETHEWVRREEDDIFIVGITEHAQDAIGEVVFVELPDLDANVKSSDEVCVVESVKSVSDIYSPLSGTIIAVNEELEDSPSLVNKDAFSDGWLFKIKATDVVEFEELLTEEDYQKKLAEKED